tara:strand:- start:5334 stop:6155 length:822 start_codon:yes stop_codon:yes gene_type:complete
MKNNFIFCNNCGKSGHLFQQCKQPITSIGIITISPKIYNKDENKNDNKFLLIRRKDTLGYVDFIRGKYKLYNINHIVSLINEMTINEKQKLLNNDFDYLWSELWGKDIGIQYRNEESDSKIKFQSLKNGYVHNDEVVNFDTIIKKSTTNWTEPEWGFPKGRRNYQENDIDCAIREWEEESGYSRNQIKIVSNLLPFEEIFIGSNFKSYKHKYFVAIFVDDINNIDHKYQDSEISKVAWTDYKDSINIFRDYNLEKKHVLNKVYKVINDYRLYY